MHLIWDLKNKCEKIFEIKVTKKAIRCIGIYIGYDKEECYNQNWMRIYHDIEKLFESWKRRKLTIFGKPCTIRRLAISKPIYASSIFCFPDKNYVKKMQILIFNFVWDWTDCKLQAFKAAWIPRLLKPKRILFNMINMIINSISILTSFYNVQLPIQKF